MNTDLNVVRPTEHRALVYTCAGDNDNLRQWTRGAAEFDLFATYYGDREPGFADHVNFWHRAKGPKYGNLKYASARWPDLFRGYEAVFVLDDDIRIDTAGINRLFELRAALGVTVLQPAFDPRGKISHPITRFRPGSQFRIVSFVENGVALFEAGSLWSFLEVYDRRLNGYGVDWLYVEHLRLDVPGRAAIVDEVVCSNPYRRGIGGHREIDLRSSEEERIAAWELVKRERKLRGELIGTRTFRTTPLRGVPSVVSYVRYAVASIRALPRAMARAVLIRFPDLRKWIVTLARG